MSQQQAITDAKSGTLTLRLFGGLEVRVNNQPLPRLRSRKGLWLLALLVLRGGKATERQWLVERLWPDLEDSWTTGDPRNGLRVCLADLRKALGDQEWRLGSPSPGTLAFDLTGTDCDLTDFDAAIERGDLPALALAARLHRGPLLDGISEEWAEQERVGRELLCRSALDSLTIHALASGEHSQAVDWMRCAIALDPTRAEPVLQIMRALENRGQTEEAMAAYREYTARLESALGQTPDEHARQAYERLQSKFDAPPLPEWTPRDPLPASLTDLIGRGDEIPNILLRLRSSRLVTLLGSGGVGKTTLAVAVAGLAEREIGTPVCFVRLEALTDERLVSLTVRAALGIGESPGSAEEKTLCDFLRDRFLLLVLDNCEHLMPACASLIEALLPSCPRLTILATSRQAFGLPYETRWRVLSLAVPDPDDLTESEQSLELAQGYSAVQLFVERAQTAHESFALTSDNVRLVADLCRRLDGIPLALEIAAAATRILSLAQIAERLEKQFDSLSNVKVLTLPRHQTLGTVIAWSYERLSLDERRLLAQLSVFSGGWTLEAAESVCTDGLAPTAIVGLLTALTDKSLVVYEDSPIGAGRFRLLETIRQYAQPHLGEGTLREVCHRRHRDWFLSLARRGDTQLYERSQIEWLARLVREQDNLRAALDFCAQMPDEAEPGLSLAAALTRFWRMRGALSEGRARLAGLLALPAAQVPTHARAEALDGAGALARMQCDYAVAIDFHEESLAIMRSLNDLGGMARALHNLGNIAFEQEDYARAAHLYEESLALARRLNDPEAVANSLACLAEVRRYGGNFNEIEALLEESLALRRAQGNLAGVANTLLILSGYRWDIGLQEEAISLTREALTLALEAGDLEMFAYGLDFCIIINNMRGDWERAACLLGAASILRERIGFPRVNSITLQIAPIQVLSREMGEAAFQAAWENGIRLSVEQVCEYAVAEQNPP